MERSISKIESAFEKYGQKKDFNKILDELEKIAGESKSVIDYNIPQKPLIGIVGEIYLRTHTHSNQDLIKVIEKHGGEVVNASITEWVNYISYSDFMGKISELRLDLKQFNIKNIIRLLKEAAKFRIQLFYQEMRQKQAYDRIKPLLDIEGDHKVSHLDDVLRKEDLFSFEIGTEACLSIASILEYAREGFNGIVNVYPFTCMPSTATSAIINPVMNKMSVPYLDTPYDSSFQPGREAAIRTFMYQATEHMGRNGRKTHIS
jgi:predicted nucleotide-binding protein (sugar kinase/HSP70/actin superfamily)